MTDEFEHRLRAGLQQFTGDVTELDAHPAALAVRARTRVRRRRWFAGAASLAALVGLFAASVVVQPSSPPLIAVAPTGSGHQVDPASQPTSATAPTNSQRNPLIGTAWTVERLPGGPITGTVLARRPWLRLAADGSVEGHDGCASFTGRWYRDGEDVRFGDLKRDAKPCPSVSPRLDFLGALQASTRSHHTDASLVLSDAGGIELLRFHPVTDTGGPAPTTVQMRVANASGKDIARVDLLQGRTRVSFGAVKDGAVGPYKPADGPVYRYTGFDVTFSDGTHQEVRAADYVGEEPLASGSYTYVLLPPTSTTETLLSIGLEEEGQLAHS